MKTRGTVIDVGEKTAKVRVERTSACASCHDCAGKDACHAEFLLSDSGKTVCVTAFNDVGAKVGDTVEVETDDRPLAWLSFVTFVLPFLFAFACWFAAKAFGQGTDVCALSATVGLVVSFAVLSLAANAYSRKRVRICIGKIIEESGRDTSAT